MNLDYLTVGRKIRLLRKRKGLTQLDLAESIHVSESYVSYLENGFKFLSVENLIAIANVLDTTPDYLLAEYLTGATRTALEDVMVLLGDCSPEECQLLCAQLQSLKTALRNLRPNV